VAAVGDKVDRAASPGRSSRIVGPLDRLFLLAIVLGLLATVLLAASGIHAHAIHPTLDLAIDTAALIVCIALTTLAWARFRERRVVAAAYHAAAFMALAVAYGIAVLITLEVGGRVTSSENPQVLVFAVARLAAATLFVIAGVYTRRPTYGMSPVWILLAPTLAVVAAALAGRWLGPPPEVLQLVTFDSETALPEVTLSGAVIHLVTASLFFAGAYASRRLWHTARSAVDAWIAIGLVFAGFAELHWVLFPSSHPGQVSTADLFWLACSGCLLAGLASALRATLRDLRRANTELAQLRDAEVQRAAMEERTRLARELHDGLAQDLWLAKLRIGELAGMEHLPVEARRAPPCAVPRPPTRASAPWSAVRSRSTATGSGCASSSPSRAIHPPRSPRGHRPRSCASPRRPWPTSHGMLTQPW
jgi:signal transduction histidine kinase